MCDTVVVTAQATRDGVTLFGKNSDREPNEAHHLLHVPAGKHSSGERVRCTYIDIPQVKQTYAALLAKPFWIWGAEMGVNEHGLAIGNEAIFSKEPAERKPSLLGMDLLRLALERAATAREAVSVITELLSEYGQGGNHGFSHSTYYHNSFLIADPAEAWVLETVGRNWAAKQVRGVYAISNGLTIESDWDLASPHLVQHAIDRGWCKGRHEFSFARCYSDVLYTRFSQSRERRACNLRTLARDAAKSSVASLIAALRSHGEPAADEWRPDRGLTTWTVCMHAGFGPVRNSQTTGSMVSYLHPQRPVHFVTATSAPCTSIFKPVWVDAAWGDSAPSGGSTRRLDPTGTFDDASLFWQHERLQRATLLDYRNRLPLYRSERDQLEQAFVEEALAKAGAGREQRSAFSRKCFEQAAQAEARWLERIAGAPRERGLDPLYAWAWRAFNRRARMPRLG